MTAITTPSIDGKAPAPAEMAVRRLPVRSVRVYWPVSGRTLARVGSGDVDVLREDESFAALLHVLRTSACAGDFGVYRDVFEVGVGVEGFTTGHGARPTFGSVGDSSLSPTLTVTTHIDARTPDAEISRLLSRVLDAHPWEVPVVELSAPFDLVFRA
ncbi:hypothetical protein [Nonomuraea sp. NPDC050691]|uniref:hypothetical protein n=1 Tax=Nonomuraea sp. NPDC050691 TaxID=3155661 RepID=UPI0033F7FB61